MAVSMADITKLRKMTGAGMMDLSRVKIMWTNYPNMPTGANATMELYEKMKVYPEQHAALITLSLEEMNRFHYES